MVALYPTHQYVTPLLHCEIGVENIIFELLHNIINEYIERYAPGEESIRLAVPCSSRGNRQREQEENIRENGG
jgi:hypothetical protein